ncbi:hypothetical protein ACFSL6_14205 [Paenibacillus thailandensis]|uniref:DUF2577 domain-containing protein n=1 Tax=Paenibacillus thailandensis TaxID=393250 RepID=A0ABW5R1M3_9BACL
MSGIFGKIIRTAAQTIKEQGGSIPITAAMLQLLLEMKPIEGVEQLKVELADERLTITGKVKRLIVPIPFTIALKPTRTQGRLLHFEVVQFSPADFETVKKKVLTQPPLVSYEQGEACFDLNGLDIVKKVPVGSISSVEIKSDKLWVRLGL